MAKANARPVKRRKDFTPRIGTCTKCRTKKTQVIKVRGVQLCVGACIGKKTEETPMPAILQEMFPQS